MEGLLAYLVSDEHIVVGEVVHTDCAVILSFLRGIGHSDFVWVQFD